MGKYPKLVKNCGKTWRIASVHNTLRPQYTWFWAVNVANTADQVRMHSLADYEVLK